MAAAGVPTPAETAAVRHKLHHRADEGTFSSGYDGFVVRVRKPE